MEHATLPSTPLSRRQPGFRPRPSLALVTAGLCVLAVAGVFWLAGRSQHSVLRKGQRAPQFALTDQEGRTHRLADYAGRPVLVAFYPGADELSNQGLVSLRDALRNFDALGVKVFAVSRGDTRSQRPFHDGEKLNFPLLSDPDGRVSAQYGIGPQGDRDGRAAYLIGPKGTVVQPIPNIEAQRQGEQLAVLTECCLQDSRQAHLRSMGKPVAETTLPRVADGKPEPLFGEGKHAATVLCFISAECPCSQGYDERLKALARDYESRGVRFLAVNASTEDESRIREHQQRAGYPFPVLRDRTGALADRLEAKVSPEVYVMDAERKLRYHGRIDDSRDPALVHSNDLRNALDALLLGKMPPQPETSTFGCAIARTPRL